MTTAQATGNVGEDTIVLSTTPNQSLSVGMNVYGTGIAPGATITSFIGPTSSVLQLSANNVGAVNGTVTFQTPAPASPPECRYPYRGPGRSRSPADPPAGRRLESPLRLRW